MNIIKKIEGMAARLERAKEIVSKGYIWPIYGKPGVYVAKSATGQQDGNGQVKLYLVDGQSCTCADYRRLKAQNGGWCKHRLAREILLSQGGEANANAGGAARRSSGRTEPQPVQRRRAEPIGSVR